jgi:serine/threonine protein kinase/Tfp pilus assembly protein PilF
MRNRNQRFDSPDQANSINQPDVSVPAKHGGSEPNLPIDPNAAVIEFPGATFDPGANNVVDADGSRADTTPRPLSTGLGPARFQVSVPVLRSGQVLGDRYEILQLLGEGGMGAVYKAMDRELERPVALKLMRPELAAIPSILARFKQELLLAQQVTHKNVIRIYDLGETEGVKFITMEFVEGEDLRELIQEKKKLSPEDSVEIIQQACRGLEAAHSVGVIHRDLKPQNIMRDRTGRILVMDFGLARTVGGDGMTQTGAVVGTVEYMSPEQSLAKDLDQRSDVFSVGLILYEMLTGDRPFKAESAVASLIKRNSESAIPVSDHDGTIPRALSNIVSKCLERNPNLRYQSATELLRDLDAWKGNHADATLGFQPVVEPGERRTHWLLAAGIATVLVLAIVAFTFPGPLFSPFAKKAASGPAMSLAILPFRNASGDPNLDWLSSSLAEMLTTDVGQSSQLRTVSPNRLYQVLSDLHVSAGSTLDLSNVRRLAELSSADTVVWGQYVKFGEQIRIDATLQDLKRERRVTLKAESSNQKDLLATIDRLAQSIRENLALSPSLIKELQEQSFKPTSTSLDALRFYNEGIQLARQGNHLDAMKRFQESVKVDPEFALAYSRLAQTYATLGYDNEADQASRRALDLSQGLPAREKYLIAADRALIANDNAKAIEAYETLIKVAPNDPELLSHLAGLYSETSEFDRSRELYKRLLELDPKNVDVLLATGRVEIRSGNSQASLEYLDRALRLAIQMENQDQRAAILHATGVAFKELNKPEDAMRYLQDSLVIKRRLGQKKGIAVSLNELAQVQAELGKPEASLASFQEALQLRRDISDQKGVGDTLIDLGGHYQDSGRYDEALKLYKESLQIQRDVGNESDQALCLNNIGVAYLSKGDYDNARTYFEQALQLRQKFKVPGDTADTRHNLAETSAKTGQFDKALDQYLEALQLYRSADDKYGAAKESYSMGTVFEYQGRYGAAISSKQDALKTFRELQDRSFWMAEILGGYGHALALAGRGDDALQNFDEALRLAQELKNQALIAQTLDFQGDSSFYRGDLREARRLYEQAAKAASHSTDRHSVLLANLNLIKVAVKEGASKDAIVRLKSLAQEADALGLKYLSLEASVYLAEVELGMKDYSRARQDLERTLVRSDRLGLRALTAQIRYLLGTALRLSGNQKEAWLHYKESVRLLDEIRKEAGSEKILQRSDLNSIYNEATRWSNPSKA